MLGFAPLGGAPLGAPSPDPTGPPASMASDQVTIGDTLDVDVNSLDTLTVEGVVMGDTLAVQWFANGRLAELIYPGDTTYQGAQQYNPVPVEADDIINIGDPATIARGLMATIADTIQVADILLGQWGMVVTETLRFQSPLSGLGIYNLFARETMRLADKVANALPVTMQDAVWLSSLVDAKTAIRIIETVRVIEQFQGGALYNVSLVQAMRLADSLKQFFGADLVDAVGVAEMLTAMSLVSGATTDGLVLEDSYGGQLMLAVTLDESIELTPAQAIQMLFEPTLTETVGITAGWLEPNGSFTTWAMNTRTGAVSEYADFAFNSFASIGNVYLGASPDGLFELRGDTDDGDDIIASIKGGYLQFGGTQLSRLKEAYIAARNDGNWVLRLETGDGDTYVYEVANRSMRSSKFHMGKGQRARYFSYELISTGQDFDLDTLEFVPIVVQRRV